MAHFEWGLVEQNFKVTIIAAMYSIGEMLEGSRGANTLKWGLELKLDGFVKNRPSGEPLIGVRGWHRSLNRL